MVVERSIHAPTAGQPQGGPALVCATRRSWTIRCVLAVSCLVIAVGAAARLSGFEVWDDGLMFARYAENLAQGGEVAWNPGGEPTWGLTSLGQLVWVSTIRAVSSPVGGDALAWVVVSSWLAGLGFVALLWRAARRSADAAVDRWCLTWTAACLALGFGSVGAHFGTDMDTMLALSWLTGFAMLAAALEADTGRRPALAAMVAVVAAGTFFVRPDAAVFPALVLLALVLWSPDRRRALAVSMGAAVAGGLLWLAARWYFGTWWPLPFYVKGAGRHYGDAFAAEYAGVAGQELGHFVLAFWLPVLAVVLDVAIGPRRWWRRTTAVEKGLAAATGVFVLYHLTQVAPIMGASQRFYQPALPALLWLSWGSFERLSRHLVGRRTVAWPLALAVGVGLALSLVAEGSRLWTSLQRESWPTLDLETAWQLRAQHYWPSLDVVAALPPGVSIAATEVGLPGAMNPGKIIVDLAGLHDPAFALHGFSADRLFRDDVGGPRRPQVIYLPHPHYQPMLRELLDHPVLRDEYRVYEAAALGSVLGVAVLRGSVAEGPLAAALDGATAARSRP